MADDATSDVRALAKGGRTNIFGFLLRLAARLPFLYFAGRWYGADLLGRFAYAVLVVEFAAQIATLGLKRGLAEQLAADDERQRHMVWDALLLALLVSLGAAVLLATFPRMMFPSGDTGIVERLFPLIVFPIAATDIALAALAYRFDIAASVRARSIVEPCTISLAAFAFAYLAPAHGLIFSYAAAMAAAFIAALVPMVRSYGGIPANWSPRPQRLASLARRYVPLAAADAIEWASRRLDLAILGLFASPATLGIYYVAQQVASLPQKLKTSFEPILGPVITRNLKHRQFAEISRQVSQVGFWIIAAQTGVALTLAITGKAVMGLAGRDFVAGAPALAVLLLAEVVAATAVVSESVLVYVARHRNMLISLAVIAMQAVLSFGFALIARRFAPGSQTMLALAVAAALGVSLAMSSAIKARILSRALGERVRTWRWSLLPAAGLAMLAGLVFTRLPEWVELAIGIPVMLALYGAAIWRLGFGPDDRILFRRSGIAPEV